MFEQSERWMRASRKLHTMWQGQVVTIASLAFTLAMILLSLAVALASPLSFYVGGGVILTLLLALAGAVASLVGAIICMVGLYGLRDIQPEYNTAFLYSVAGIVLGLVSNLTEEGSMLYMLLDAAQSILSLIVTWLVIQATGRLMMELERDDVFQRGRTVWLLSLASAVGAALVAVFPVGSDEMMVVFLAVSIPLLILATVAEFYFIGYLSRASNALAQRAW